MKNSFTSKQIAGVAVLLALVIALQSFSAVIPLGTLPNFALVPIVLGAIMFGPIMGAFLGLACGVVVLAQVIAGGSPFYVLIWTNDPIVTALTCLVKTTAAGLVGGYLYAWLEKKNKLVATFVTAGAVPVINTLIFIIGCLFMTNSVYGMADGQNVLIFILVGLVGFNFFFEFAFNLFFSPALNRVIEIVEKSFKGFKRK
ncbi:MAG: ECF transporter S component [Clostridia bacterium]|nr:ECF transporter S component [Clostridia bacterium]